MSRWDDRLDRHSEDLYRRPVRTSAKWGCVGTVIVVVLIAIFGIGGLVGGWFDGAKEAVGFDNSKNQTTIILQDEKEMIATAGNVCDFKDSEPESSEDDPQLVGGGASVQYKQTYRRIKADYDRRMDNAYEGRLVPKFQGDSLPREAPTLEERLEELCP